MGFKVNTHVHVAELGDDGTPVPGGRTRTFGPADGDLPEWAVRSISRDDVWEGNPPPRRRRAPVQPAASHVAPAGDSEAARLRTEVETLREEIAALRSDRKPERVAGENPAAEGGNTSPSGAEPPAAPPRSGPGSGAPEWRAYAAALHVDVDANASRDDVLKALKAAGKPTE